MKKQIKYILVIVAFSICNNQSHANASSVVQKATAQIASQTTTPASFFERVKKGFESIGKHTRQAMEKVETFIDQTKKQFIHAEEPKEKTAEEWMNSFFSDSKKHLEGIKLDPVKDEIACYLEEQIKEKVFWARQAYYGSNKEVFKGVCAKLPQILQATFAKNSEHVEKLAGDLGKAVTKTVSAHKPSVQLNLSEKEVEINKTLILRLLNSEDGQKIKQKVIDDMGGLYNYVLSLQVVKDNQDIFSTTNRMLIEDKVIPDLIDSIATHCTKQEIEVFFNFIKCFVEHKII